MPDILNALLNCLQFIQLFLKIRTKDMMTSRFNLPKWDLPVLQRFDQSVPTKRLGR